MDVLVTCKYEEDPIKNEGARVDTTLYSNFSDSGELKSSYSVSNLAGKKAMVLQINRWTVTAKRFYTCRSGQENEVHSANSCEQSKCGV